MVHSEIYLLVNSYCTLKYRTKWRDPMKFNQEQKLIHRQFPEV